MNAVLAIVFAASLSSTNVKEFFTAPAWMQTSVSSANTPGSDPSSGTGGWYVEGYTNAFTDFVAEYDYENFNILGIPIFSNGEWQFDHMIVSASWATSLTWEWDQIRIQGTGQELTIRNGLTIRADGYDYDVHGTYTRETYPSPDGIWKPKPSRLTTEVQSGVLSSFAGYCERLYFSSQGQKNEWDTSVYGPTNSLKGFWFNPTGYDMEFAYSPSSRTIDTRRLLEYDNISGLADTFINKIAAYGFTFFADSRPGWIGINESAAWSTLWWASTEGSAFTSSDIVPSFSWMQNPTALSAWGTCCQVFDCTEYDDVWHPRHYETDISYTPTSLLMKSLDFGMTPYSYDNCRPTKINKTITQIIETNFPHANARAITNSTRRLISDRLCNMNQMLSLMDRTYDVPNMEYGTAMTNLYYVNRLSSHASVPCSFVKSPGSLTWTLTPTSSSIPWDEASETSTVYGGSRTNGFSSALRYSVSGTGTSAGLVKSVTGFLVGVPGDETVIHALNESDIEDVFVIHFYPSIQNDTAGVWYSVQHSEESPVVHEGFIGTGVSVDDPAIDLHYSYSRDYNLKIPANGCYALPSVSQPGWQGSTRVVQDSMKYGAVLGVHEKPIYGSDYSPMVYDQSRSTCLWKSASGGYSSRFDLITELQTLVGEFYTKFRTDYGFDLKNPSAVIPINLSDALRVRNSISVQSAEVSVVGQLIETKVDGYYFRPNLTVVSVTTYNIETGEETPGYHSMFNSFITVSTGTMDTPSQAERDPLTMDAMMGIVTKVDWDWKALKRGND